jgi:hypothetical protein
MQNYENVDRLLHMLKKIYSKRYKRELDITDKEREVLKILLDRNEIKKEDLNFKKSDIFVLFRK